MSDEAPERNGEQASESGVRYNLLISEEAREQLRALLKPVRRNIGQRLDDLQNGLAGDVKKLTAREHKYRLRVWKRSDSIPAGRCGHLRICCKTSERSL